MTRRGWRRSVTTGRPPPNCHLGCARTCRRCGSALEPCERLRERAGVSTALRSGMLMSSRQASTARVTPRRGTRTPSSSTR